MVSDQCIDYRDEAASFVLGDTPAEVRTRMLTHLESCLTCRREVSGLAEALDSISAVVAPMAPSAGFVGRVLAAAEPIIVGPPATADTIRAEQATTPEAAAAPGVALGALGGRRGLPSGLPRPDVAVARLHRTAPVVIRRRRTILALTAATALFSVMGVGFGSWAMLVLAIAGAVLEVAYVALVISVTHTRARYEMASAFRGDQPLDDSYWRELEPELRLHGGDEAVVVPGAAVDNTALFRFVLAYFAGWLLTPVVALIALVRGDLTGIEQSPLLSHIVDMQRRGRSQSLKLLVAGATTVAVAGGGTAAMLAAPGVAAAATPASTYTVHSGDTLWGIAESHGLSVSYLAQLNGISDPARILPGQVIRLGGESAAGAASYAGTYTVRSGDTLDAIAARFGTTEGELAAVNSLPNPNLILVGQVLRLPSSVASMSSATAVHTAATGAGSPGQTPPTAYTVQRGDTLGSIAARFGTTVADLAAINHLADPNLIEVGQVLRLGGAPAPATAASTPVRTVSAPVPAGYVNPFRFGSWTPARIDEGVDWIPNVTSPVVAIGEGVITYSSMDSGWPGGGFISYRLTSGSHAGLYVYVAEHITNLLPVGTVVRAGEQIATALPGYPWTEWGWASSNGPAPAPASQYNGAPDGTATPGGKAFARFLLSLGATGIADPGPGPTAP